MRSFVSCAILAAGLWLAPHLVACCDKPPVPQPGCGGYGTSVDFEESPKAAADKAKKEEKLVFILHVSGEFEDSGLT